jgi:translation initiation factor eIF-2B subunit epsilon
MLILGDASGAMRLRYDLFDTHIDVCSVEVLQLMKVRLGSDSRLVFSWTPFFFQDNFDYQSVRGDFMTGVLGDDITDHRLFVHILESEYAARVKDLHTYASVSHDVLHRWVSPVMVDNSLLNPKSSYRLTRHTVYREKNVRTHLSSRIGPDVVLGQGCVVGESTVISKTVVGANVTIGKNCSIVNCFLWDGVQIEVCSSVHL